MTSPISNIEIDYISQLSDFFSEIDQINRKNTSVEDVESLVRSKHKNSSSEKVTAAAAEILSLYKEQCYNEKKPKKRKEKRTARIETHLYSPTKNLVVSSNSPEEGTSGWQEGQNQLKKPKSTSESSAASCSSHETVQLADVASSLNKQQKITRSQPGTIPLDFFRRTTEIHSFSMGLQTLSVPLTSTHEDIDNAVFGTHIPTVALTKEQSTENDKAIAQKITQKVAKRELFKVAQLDLLQCTNSTKSEMGPLFEILKPTQQKTTQ